MFHKPLFVVPYGGGGGDHEGGWWLYGKKRLGAHVPLFAMFIIITRSCS